MKALKSLLLVTALALLALISLTSQYTRAAPMSPQSTIAISLSSGWNLISIPVSQPNSIPASLFSGLGESQRSVWAYRAVSDGRGLAGRGTGLHSERI